MQDLDVPTLEQWLWGAACKIRGDIDAPKYKDYILPLIFLKRLSDVFEDEFQQLKKEYGSEETVEHFLSEDPELVRFYVPEKARWKNIAVQSTDVGQYLTDAVRSIARHSPDLQGVIDIVDFNARTAGQRIISDDKLKDLIDTLGKYRLGINDVEPDILGRAYEYLLRKFAEGSGQSAGEFYTPREVAVLMSYILDPEPGEEIYDPCCGSGGLLIKCFLRFKEKYSADPTIEPLKFFGQELLHSTYAMAKMNAFIHYMETKIALGDTMLRPAFLENGSALRKFDIVTANPMWNQDYSQDMYENDTYERFSWGIPPSNSADWGWIQHMFASLSDNGRMAVVLDTGAISRGSGSVGKNRERDIRKEFVEKDLIETVILLPENLFYNTPAPGIVLVINRMKKRAGQILLINASNCFQRGTPKNYLSSDNIYKISQLCNEWREEEGISKIIDKKTISIENDYNLTPSRYIMQNSQEETLSLEDAVVLLQQTEEERQKVDENLKNILKELNLWD